MKTFKNLKSGVLEHVTNEELLKQYETRTDLYELVGDKEPTLNDLKKEAKEMGINFHKNIKKDELLTLISANKNN